MIGTRTAQVTWFLVLLLIEIGSLSHHSMAFTVENPTSSSTPNIVDDKNMYMDDSKKTMIQLVSPSPVVLNKLSINGSSLSITSFRFNPRPMSSMIGRQHGGDWVNRLFGKQQAVFWEFPPSASSTIPHGEHVQPLQQALSNYNRLHSLSQENSTSPLRVVDIEDWLESSVCSIEMLGFVLTDRTIPFLLRDKHRIPSVGFGSLTLNSGSVVSCLYRATYDNWRNSEIPETKPHYWPIYFVCPSSTLSQLRKDDSGDASSFGLRFKHRNKKASKQGQCRMCQDFLNRHIRTNESSPFKLVHSDIRIQLQYANMSTATSQIWSSRIETVLNDHYDASSSSELSSLMDDTQNMKATTFYHQITVRKPVNVVCTAIPYEAISTPKTEAVNAILFEWIRYYTVMGFKVILYDRDGWNHGRLRRNPYVKLHLLSKKGMNETMSFSQTHHSRKGRRRLASKSHRMLSHHHHFYDHTNNQWKEIIDQNLIYHNYTILSKLMTDYDPLSMKAYTHYDNADGITDQILKFDDDHTLSLSHCRFEALARYGYTRVLINDFDEFLYCRKGLGNLQSQKEFIGNYLDFLEQYGYDQVSFLQRIVKQRTLFESHGQMYNETVEQCVIRQVDEANRLYKVSHKELPVQLPSVFNCISEYDKVVMKQWPKSMHYGLGCPLTTDHAACGNTIEELRHYDCAGTSAISIQCTLIHVSMRQSDYLQKGNYRNKKGDSSISSSNVTEINEIGKILSELS